MASISASSPHRLAPHVRVHRQRVDHVGPAVAVGVAVAQQLLGDLVPVVADQDGAELVPRRNLPAENFSTTTVQREVAVTARGGRLLESLRIQAGSNLAAAQNQLVANSGDDRVVLVEHLCPPKHGPRRVAVRPQQNRATLPAEEAPGLLHELGDQQRRRVHVLTRNRREEETVWCGDSAREQATSEVATTRLTTSEKDLTLI